MKTKLLLYGAYGYTGQLTAERALQRHVDLVLAGRNRSRLDRLGRKLGFPIRVADLSSSGELDSILSDVGCVIHMAGPFAETSAPMLDACIRTKTNYIDVTGEVEVFESIWAKAELIKQSGITVIPGAGFDVVPSDCLAAYVAEAMPDASSLTLAIHAIQSPSRGTLRTALRQITRQGLVRRKGALVPLCERALRWIAIDSKKKEPFLPVPWGDLTTAFHSTGIGNITTYIRRTRPLQLVYATRMLFAPLLRSKIGKQALAYFVGRFPEGPTVSQRQRQGSTIWAEATNASGDTVSCSLSTPDAYDFAADSALEIALRIVSSAAPAGLNTPSQAFGADFVLDIPRCSRTDLSYTHNRQS